MSQVRKNDHSLMKVLLGPVISEKATMVASNTRR
jgi:large subunit ribosomal protein L23